MSFYDKRALKDNTEIMPARCTVTGEYFDIDIRRNNGKLMMVQGIKRKDKVVLSSGPTSYSTQKRDTKAIAVDGGIYTEKTYHCPICGNKDIVRCGKCHNITCYDGSGTFKCAHCGNSGKVSGTIQQIPVHNAGMKKHIQEGDKPYYPGDKPYYSGDKPFHPGDK